MRREPPYGAVENGDFVVRSGLKTDFWQRTHYGFQRDNGHFLYREWSGDFTAETHFTGRYETLYDQAGMMLRTGAEHWIKCGIEYTESAMHLSVVVTHAHSDWSVEPITTTAEPIGVRMTRQGDACAVSFRVGDRPWHMARLAWFPPEPATVSVGLAFCSPEREGFEARYHGFSIGTPIGSAAYLDLGRFASQAQIPNTRQRVIDCRKTRHRWTTTSASEGARR